MTSGRLVDFTESGDQLVIVGAGSWTAGNAEDLEARIAIQPAGYNRVKLDMAGVREFDTYGAWLLERLMRGDGHPREVTALDLPERFRGLFDKVRLTNRQQPPPRARGLRLLTGIETLGQGTIDAGADALQYLDTVGAFITTWVAALAFPKRLRFTSIVHQLDRVGLRAIPIIVLITLLIGAIIAQQGFFYFRKMGAEDYVVDLVGVLVLREIGVLIVAIMVAGRSGSSYTAELGSMKMREEIDALRTMGRDPMEVLILPRVLALIVALPLLTFIGSMSALLGGALVSSIYGAGSPLIFLLNLRDAVSISDFEVGMIKSPFMALAIGLVACTEGMKVRGSAESLGLQTTTSVVKSIFLVIVMDGLFAIFFSSIGM
jgi:phospholipid/cholesterol/gamma-HCH transport system permease protein